MIPTLLSKKLFFHSFTTFVVINDPGEIFALYIFCVCSSSLGKLSLCIYSKSSKLSSGIAIHRNKKDKTGFGFYRGREYLYRAQWCALI